MSLTGLQREQFANIEAGDVGGDRSKRPPVFGRGVWLHVPCFKLAGTAPHPKENDRRMGACVAGSGLGGEQVGQAETAHPQRADPQEFAAADNSTADLSRTIRLHHGRLLKAIAVS